MRRVNDKARKELLRIKTYFKKNLPLISDYVKSHFVGRSNELSNWMEGEVAKELIKIKGFEIKKPVRITGGMLSSAYPDLYVTTKSERFYLEIKVFQNKTSNSSLRTFYYKPSDNSKVTVSCPHILLAFEVESLKGNNESPFVIKDFKMIDLYDLKVRLKPEFNASNIELYKCAQT
jgi:hypothetical protein